MRPPSLTSHIACVPPLLSLPPQARPPHILFPMPGSPHIMLPGPAPLCPWLNQPLLAHSLSGGSTCEQAPGVPCLRAEWRNLLPRPTTDTWRATHWVNAEPWSLQELRPEAPFRASCCLRPCAPLGHRTGNCRGLAQHWSWPRNQVPLPTRLPPVCTHASHRLCPEWMSLFSGNPGPTSFQRRCQQACVAGVLSLALGLWTVTHLHTHFSQHLLGGQLASWCLASVGRSLQPGAPCFLPPSLGPTQTTCLFSYLDRYVHPLAPLSDGRAGGIGPSAIYYSF